MLPFAMGQLEHTLRVRAKGTINVDEVESRITELKEQTMELIKQCTGNYTVYENEGKLRAMSDEVKALSDMLTEYRHSCNAEDSVANRISAITEAIENEPEHSDTYNDIIVRQLIDTIKVMGENKIEIIFKSGFRYEQSINLQVKKASTAA